MSFDYTHIDPLIVNRFRKLIDPVKEDYGEESVKVVEEAFFLAYDAHKDAVRKSGEPYIIHPIEVGIIVAEEIGLGVKSITAALLHDVVEDTSYTLQEIEEKFGTTIMKMVDGLTKLDTIFEMDKSTQAENFKKLILALTKDVRVILIKLADRLHNMRTLEAMPEHKQIKIASETLFLFTPIAQRMGLYGIKTELEELGFKYRYSDIYREISNHLELKRSFLETEMADFIEPIKKQLAIKFKSFEIHGRIKTIPSIWSRMNNEGLSFDEIPDPYDIQIIFDPNKHEDAKEECWHIYSLITDIYNPKPEHIRDWISTPKVNGYQALHLTVMGSHGNWKEIQIRTRNMHEIAEYGYLRYWKSKGLKAQETVVNQWIDQLRKQLDENINALEFIDEFRSTLLSTEISVFTPKGHPKKMPGGSTLLDFAYEIHSVIGNKCVGGKVNYKTVSRDYVLKTGDQVEVLTSEIQRAQLEWLDFVITPKAKLAIKANFKAIRKESIEKGKQELNQILKELKVGLNSREFKEMINAFNFYNRGDFYFALALNQLNPDQIIKYLKQRGRRRLMQFVRLQFRTQNTPQKGNVRKEDEESGLLIGKNEEEVNYKLASCCNPIPGDPAIGFTDSKGVIEVHTRNCEYATQLLTTHGNKQVDVRWRFQKKLSLLAKLELTGIDSIGLVNRVTRVISDELNVNMHSIAFKSNNGVFSGVILMYVSNTKDLNNLILKLMQVKGIDSVNRVEQISEDEL